MGLDSVELLLATEEEFKIAISDEEASHCITPRLLADLVYSKLRKSKQDTCPSMHGFYVVRKALMEQLGVPREIICPDAELDGLIGRSNRKAAWAILLHRLSGGQTIYAPLVRPRWVMWGIYLLSFLIFTSVLLVTKAFSLSLIVSCVLGMLVFAITSVLRIQFPRDFSRVKDLARVVGTLDSSVWSGDEVYLRVRKLVSEQLGVKEEDIYPDSHLVNDLGMG